MFSWLYGWVFELKKRRLAKWKAVEFAERTSGRPLRITWRKTWSAEFAANGPEHYFFRIWYADGKGCQRGLFSVHRQTGEVKEAPPREIRLQHLQRGWC